MVGLIPPLRSKLKSRTHQAYPERTLTLRLDGVDPVALVGDTPIDGALIIELLPDLVARVVAPSTRPLPVGRPTLERLIRAAADANVRLVIQTALVPNHQDGMAG
jgi:hypothetical protein